MNELTIINEKGETVGELDAETGLVNWKKTRKKKGKKVGKKEEDGNAGS